jgi:DNA-binding winged helix-turn-helix (wHTH) protein/tetratricopeptide (TPR) repeat protein
MKSRRAELAMHSLVLPEFSAEAGTRFSMAAGADPRSRLLYEFGPFRLDADKELLLREDETVPIAPKAFQILLVLIRHNKQVVTKDDLMKTIWPDTFVEEANLSRNIFLLRKALGESPQDHQYVVTVPGRGYRFAENVQLVPDRELSIVAASHSRVEVQGNGSQPWGWGAAVAVLIVAAGVLGWRHFGRRPAVLSERDTVVLADFANSTGDSVFDGTLRLGLATELEQSPFLKILDDEQMRRDLYLMNVRPGVSISQQIAHDVCVREGGAAIIEGAIASMGKSYVVTLQAIACKEGTTIAREQVQTEDKEHVLGALDSAAAAMRNKLGESHGSIRDSNQPLERATTSSLEALQYYTEGLAVMGQGHFLASIPLYQRAIHIDPDFTMAYFVMAVAYEQAGDMDQTAAYAKRAFDLSDRVSAFEQMEIRAYYYRFTGEWDKEIDAWQTAIREQYPRKWGFHNQLAVTYNDMGRFEDGLREGLEAVRLQPDLEAPYRRVLDAYMCLDRLAEADKTAAEARAEGIDGSRIHQRFLEIAYLEGDQAAIAKETQWFAGKPEEYLSFGLRAADLNLHGRRRESHKEYRRAADAARRLGFRYVADEFDDADARADALSGDCARVHALGRPALGLALCGEAKRAEELAAKTSAAFPNGMIWNAVQLPEIRAAIAMRRGDAAESIDLLASASPYERAYPDAIYLRGLACLRMKRGAEALAEFRKIADHEGASWGATWVHPNWGQYYALSYLGMARGYVLAGDATRAKDAYQNFLALWKTGDPALPVFAQGRAEFAKLQ